MAAETIIAQAPARSDMPGSKQVSRNVVLVVTDTAWAVWLYLRDGTRHGKRYPAGDDGETAARAHFRFLTEAEA